MSSLESGTCNFYVCRIVRPVDVGVLAKLFFCLVTIMLWGGNSCYGQVDYRIIEVLEANSQEPLIGAEVFRPNGKALGSSDELGRLRVPCPLPTSVLIVRYFTTFDTLRLTPDQNKNCDLITLEVKTVSTLEEVVVTNGRTLGTSTVSFLPDELTRNRPMMLGQPDLMRGLSLEPGIAHGQEGNANLLVRGGSSDQNLILIDDAPIYNANHLGGFLSIVNDDVVKSLSIYKTTPPIAYGGRLSSLIDVRLKEGTADRWRGRFGIGLLTANIYAEGPIVNDKTSLILGGRVGYFELINLGKNRQAEENLFDYRMRDVTAKLTHRFSAKSKLFLSAYYSKDATVFSENTFGLRNFDRVFRRDDSDYDSQTLSIRYFSELSSRIRLVAFAYYARYRNGYATLDNRYVNQELVLSSEEKVRSSVSDLGASSRIQYSSSIGDFQLGVQASKRDFNPLNSTLNGVAVNINELKATTRTATLFADVTKDFGTIFSVYGGFRLSQYNTHGYERAYPEFRVRLSSQLGIRSKLSLSANSAYQDVHLVSSGNLGQNTDVYLAADSGRPLQSGQHFDIGYQWSSSSGHLRFATGAYYRSMEDVLFLKNFDLDPALNQVIKDQIVAGGVGRAYGLESRWSYGKARWSGTLSYTLSRSERRFPDFNANQYFPFRYDRTHDLNLLFTKKIGKKYHLGLSFVYQTGIAVTTPVARVDFGSGLPSFDVVNTVNNARFPAYHRLDLSVAKRWVGKRGNNNALKLSIYNAYNRVNATYYSSFATFSSSGFSPDDIQITFERVGRFGLLPSIYFTHDINYDRE